MSPEKTNKSPNHKFPDGFSKIRLRLAREPDYPQGSQQHGYDLVVPLDRNGRIDAAQWKSHRDLCRVVHYRSDEEHDIGHLVRQPGGQWKFRYDIQGDEEEAAGYHFADERFTVGEYVSLIEDDGTHTYRVVTVETL
ncbi:hypothetical protein G5V57_14895 [Nordella sp. HKS 07]|uniref:hypothetical protein n=1 Tax=Nordella sp. HKS 07 TaxID=2712222 RepID=UPI0013E0FC32|nr:hypothetical protein [Nordella sp. HKS 07]QIG48898.1 hypothetical protein G5V57_14895 [Nordella sp. HKS 07]